MHAVKRINNNERQFNFPIIKQSRKRYRTESEEVDGSEKKNHASYKLSRTETILPLEVYVVPDYSYLFPKKKENPIIQAMLCGEMQRAIDLINRNEALDCKDSDGNTPLHIAVKLGLENICILLIEKKVYVNEKKVYVNEKNNEGETPLYFAVLKGHEKIIPLLFENGASLDAKDNFGITPFYLAMKKEQNNIISFFQKNIAFLDIKKNHGETLHVAIQQRNDKIINLLVKNGAPINFQDEDGNTCLHHVVYSNPNVKLYDYLIRNGANSQIKNKLNKTPHQLLNFLEEERDC